MKKIKDLGEKEVIWCKTISECEAIAELLDKENELWLDGSGYKEYKPWETLYVGKFCFHPYLNECSGLEYWESENSIIHNAKDFITEKQLSNEVKQELQDILNEWAKAKFQIPLNVIIRQRLK